MCTASWSWRVFAAAALTSTFLWPQTPHPAGAQPRIGLVLEGGAALGLAHVGVITWLEEHHIPVQYVAGTSMGGLIGGLYATGSSPAEMKELVTNMDWDQIMRDDVPFHDLAYRRKEDAQDYPNSLEFGLKAGVSFPEGLNAGHSVGLVLDRIALPYSQVTNFNELPIPFACVATDLVSGKQHVFRGGLPGHGSALHHVHPRSVRAGQRQGVHLCRWRPSGQSPGRCRQGNGRRPYHRHPP
jgi:predicted acylesterase/phospholipase RssA